jgi:TolA-binding protein
MRPAPVAFGPGEENTRMKAPLVACLTLACALAAPLAPASAQVDSREGIALQNQIAELRAQVQTLRDQLANAPPASGGSSLGGYSAPTPGGAVPPEITAQLLGRVQRLEDDVRSLRGHIDELDNARQRQAEDTDKQIADLKFEVENGTAGGGAAGASAVPPPGAPARTQTMSPPPGNLATALPGGAANPEGVPPPPPPPPPKRTAELILQEGNAAYARKDFAAAKNAAKAVLAAGAGPRATDAQLLMARALFGERDFSGAAVAFDDAYNRSRTGMHAPDALLGLAAALNEIPEKKAACQTLDKLAAEFPAMRADQEVSAATLRRDAACH